MTFDDFWAAWPPAHRVGKKQAVEQFGKLSMLDQDAAIEDVTWRTAHEPRWQRPDPKDGRCVTGCAGLSGKRLNAPNDGRIMLSGLEPAARTAASSPPVRST